MKILAVMLAVMVLPGASQAQTDGVGPRGQADSRQPAQTGYVWTCRPTAECHWGSGYGLTVKTHLQQEMGS